MKYSQLAALLTLLLATYGEITDEQATHLQEDCAGRGMLTAAARYWSLRAARRDVAWDHLVALDANH